MLHGYGALRTHSDTNLRALRREMLVPSVARGKIFSGKRPSRMMDKQVKHKRTVQPQVSTDNLFTTRKTLAKQRAARLAFDEAERAELLLLLPHYEVAHARSSAFHLPPASCNVLPKIFARAAALIRACILRPTTTHPSARPNGPCAAGDSDLTPRSAGTAAGPIVAASARVTAPEIDSIPAKDIASTCTPDRTPGLRDPPRAEASLLPRIASRAASLLRGVVRAFDRSKPAAGDDGSTAGRLARGSLIRLRAHHHGAAAGR
jgi:hypothetical protein